MFSVVVGLKDIEDEKKIKIEGLQYELQEAQKQLSVIQGQK